MREGPSEPACRDSPLSVESGNAAATPEVRQAQAVGIVTADRELLFEDLEYVALHGAAKSNDPSLLGHGDS
jgi:hypothetical protein